MTDPSSRRRDRRALSYWVGSLYLKFFGWRVEGNAPPGKFIIIAAPHTSNWDLPFALGVAYVLGIRVNFLIKESWIRGPTGFFFRWLGGIPVNRSARHNLVGQCVRAFEARESMYLVVPPEGTRSKTRYWKSGFYWIAHGAKVPILLGFLDFKRKVGGIGPSIMPTGDIIADMDKIRAFYTGVTGKRPELMGAIEVEPPGSREQKPVDSPAKTG